MNSHAAEPPNIHMHGETSANGKALRPSSPLKFCVLVFALSAPFWLLGAVFNLQLLPGLPLSALGAVCPLLAAMVLVHHESQRAGVVALLKRAFDFQRIPAMAWYIPTLLLMPAVSLAVYGLMRWGGSPVPAPQFHALSTVLMFLAFFAGALGEELGWSGYAIDPMQQRWHALPASLVLGLVNALWHIVPLLQAQRPLVWIAWWCLYAVAARVLIVWLYNHTGKSVFAVALFHTTLNLSWMLFPVQGSFFDVRLAALVMGFVAVIAVVGWGQPTRARLNRA